MSERAIKISYFKTILHTKDQWYTGEVQEMLGYIDSLEAQLKDKEEAREDVLKFTKELQQSIQRKDELLREILEHMADLDDESCADGDGYYDTWQSRELTDLIERIREEVGE